ncbi:protein of unknown function [Candidatus Methylocalor cossyra]|uniref:Uncharacterized protein n=1 Tax=Candidatus Methylocalor cossyra TaxID=3108543 RepID=A0ABP1C864_9GAMM
MEHGKLITFRVNFYKALFIFYKMNIAIHRFLFNLFGYQLTALFKLGNVFLIGRSKPSIAFRI